MTPMRHFGGGFSGGMKPEFSQGGMGRAMGGGMGGFGGGGFQQMPGGAFQRQGGMNPMVQALRGGGGMGGFGGGLESLNSLNAGGGGMAQAGGGFPRQPAPYGGGGFGKVPQVQQQMPDPRGPGYTPPGAAGRGAFGQKLGAGQMAYQQQQNQGMGGGGMRKVPKQMPMGPMTPGNGVSFAGVSGGGPGADVARMNARMGGRQF